MITNITTVPVLDVNISGKYNTVVISASENFTYRWATKLTNFRVLLNLTTSHLYRICNFFPTYFHVMSLIHEDDDDDDDDHYFQGRPYLACSDSEF